MTLGGAFQIGNRSDIVGSSVSFALTLSGPGTAVDVTSQGFLGLAVGVETKPADAPNVWTVSELFNVDTISIDIQEGTFRSNEIFTGTSDDANLIAIGGEATGGPTFTLQLRSDRCPHPRWW